MLLAMLKPIYPFLVEIVTLLTVARLFNPRYKLAFSTTIGIILVSFLPFVAAVVLATILEYSFAASFLPNWLLIAAFLMQFAILFIFFRGHFGNNISLKMVSTYAVVAVLVGIIL